jgi:hypothetical protein
MRRFVTLAILLLVSVPFGASISGCSKGTSISYCDTAQSAGFQQGQLFTLDLEPRLTGVSINQGAISSIGAPTGKDCRGASAATPSIVYSSSDRTLVDVNPTTGSGGLCAGTWNRNTGTGIADYTICTPNGREGIAYITASSSGVSSNQVAVYVHPIVTGIVLGAASTDCANDPASNCFAPNTQTCFVPSSTGSAPPVIGTPYSGNTCLSQNTVAQLAARVYAGQGTAQQNISCIAGPLTFTAQTPSVVTIDTNGLATATQPGSTIINAQNSQASSTIGSFATCPPAKITLEAAGATAPPTAPLTDSTNVTQTLTATVTDQNNTVLNNIALEYTSTTPVTIPTSLNSITPTFPGSAAIFAQCQPPNCNPSNFAQIGIFGNGLPVTSNAVQINANGTNNSTILYVASTQSQYLLPIDFTVTTPPRPVRLPYAPNSLVLSEDGTTIYMGTSNELMVYSTTSNSLTRQDNSVNGQVLASAPNNSQIVITDPVRQLVYLYSTASNAITTQYGGVATSAQYSPDSSAVYITTADGRLLVYSSFTGWNASNLTTPATGVAVTVPAAGAYLGGSPVDIRTNCPITVVGGTPSNPTATNTFYPDLGPVAGANANNTANTPNNPAVGLVTNNIASTNDGLHELTASPSTFYDIGTLQKSGACPAINADFASNVVFNAPFTTAAPTTITGVLPTSDSAYAFVTYFGMGGVVPQYAPATKQLTNIALQTTSAGTPIAPEAGVVSSDNQTFYVGTSGDSLVHRLIRGTNGFADTATPIIPALPNINSAITSPAVPNLLAQKPRKSTS